MIPHEPDQIGNGIAAPAGWGRRHHAPRTPWKPFRQRSGFFIYGDISIGDRRRQQLSYCTARYQRLKAAGLCTRNCGNRAVKTVCRGCRVAENLKQKLRRRAKRGEASK